jgi:hypothetical protein
MRAVADAQSGEAAHFVGERLSQAVDQLEQATRWVIGNSARNPNAVAAVSVPYLKLFGTVAGGWLMVLSAGIAQHKLHSPDADHEFLTSKLATARFYANHILPHATAFATTVMHGADSALAMDADSF